MDLIADLHLHSKYSRAVSPQMVIPEIARWAKKKGIGLVGTADWTHPLWLRELRQNLKEAGEGIYQADGIYFLLSTEISSIYSQGGKGRRIHNLVLARSFEAVEKINATLRSRGANLLSDGRPIIGLSSIQLAELIFSVDKNCLIIPAHAWTPHFSVLGSNSGFDSLKECFGEFAQHIYAIETGLSSDPGMNWRIAELDNRSIVSFSDAHSPQKLGREATVFEVEDIKKLRCEDIKKAIKEQRIAYTIEFYPEEGKYHWTGHRKCGVKHSPEETKKLGEICPVCGRQLTVGVMHRVEQLASRPEGFRPDDRPNYKMLVPLMEILAEAFGVGFSSQRVLSEYDRMIDELGSELAILLAVPIEKIAKVSGERIAEGIKKVRTGEIVIEPGYDGVFGKVKIWGEGSHFAEASRDKQMSLF